MIYNRYVKRMLDIILSLAAIICLSPVFLIVAAVVCITMGFPVLFSQERMGKDEKVFRLYKFRSMTNAKDKNGNLLPEQKRLTKAGKLLRSLSVDELPELFSILAGDMSFVGPRPLPVYYKPYFLPKERVRHKVRGGLIPSDDLSGKVMTSWEEHSFPRIEGADGVETGFVELVDVDRDKVLVSYPVSFFKTEE